MHVEDLLRQIMRQYELVSGELAAGVIYKPVLDCGERMEVQPLTVSEARQIAELAGPFGGMRCFETNQCYFNAQRLRLRAADYNDNRTGIHYCEGYVAEDRIPLPIAHAWLTVNGKVVDVTLRAKSKSLRHSYFGLKIPVRMLLRHQMESGYYDSVLEGPQQAELFRR